jgi:hypothetical protein
MEIAATNGAGESAMPHAATPTPWTDDEGSAAQAEEKGVPIP